MIIYDDIWEGKVDIIYEIQRIYNSFSDKEKSIADYIMQNRESIKNINITDLAKVIGTSGATITRFAKKIGCNSFVDMKIMLGSNKMEKVVEDDDEIFSYTYQYYNEVIERTKMLIDKRTIFKVVDELKKARSIYIYGVGSSGLTGKEMMQRLLRMGFNVHCISDSHMMIINSSIVTNNDLVIGISISGETVEVIHSLRRARENGAKTVCITSFEESSISKYSDIEFTVYNPKFIDKNKFINSQFSVMYLLDLISMVLLKDEELNKKMKITIDAIINNY
nr:MurR/RpiR family transcriptional regulator [Clostridium gallinarum]